MGLLPDVMAFFEVNLLDALPDNARIAALNHTNVFDMARAADAVVIENRAAAESLSSPAINSLSLLDSDVETRCPQPLEPCVAAVAAGRDRPPYKKTDTLCAVHARWGKEAYKCLSRTCKMRHIIACPPPQSTPSASGNGKAGGH